MSFSKHNWKNSDIHFFTGLTYFMDTEFLENKIPKQTQKSLTEKYEDSLFYQLNSNTKYFNLLFEDFIKVMKDINKYIPKEWEIHIPVPQRNVKKRKLFSFLDEEEEMNEQ